MNDLVVIEEKRGFFARVKSRSAAVVVAVSATFGAVVPAIAAPDAEAIAAQISATDAVVDSSGSAMISVFVGIMIFAIIIGMIARKGK